MDACASFTYTPFIVHLSVQMNPGHFKHQSLAHQLQLDVPPSTATDLQHDMDSDDADSLRPGKRSGRRKIKIEYIKDKSRRHITFSKRKAGIMKKVFGWK